MLLMLSGCNKDNASADQSGDNPGEKITAEGTLPPIEVELPKDNPTPAPSKPNLDFGSNPTMQGINTDFSKNYVDMFTERDLDGAYDSTNVAVVQFNGDSISTDSKAVKLSGTKMLLDQEGTYIFRGMLYNGMIIVEADDTAKIQIVLDGVDMASLTSAPIYVKSANKVFITLAQGTQNRLSNGGTFEQTDENKVDSVIFSKQDLTVNGAGVLLIDSPAGHGIVSKDDLVIAGGSYVINVAERGLDANDSVRLANAFMTLQAGKDGIRAKNDEDATRGYVYINDGEYDISAGGDAISASSNVQIDSGKFDLKTGVGNAEEADANAPDRKAIKADGSLLVVDGRINIESYDDAVNVKGAIVLAGGEFTVKAGDDAFHADKDLYAVNATVEVTDSREALEAFNIDIRGGKLTLSSSDDGINVAGGKDSNDTEATLSNEKGTLKISGGEISISALGDGIDVKGEFSMSDGLLRISVSAKDGNSIFDYESGGQITGGVFIASGSKEVAHLPEFESQGMITVTTGSRDAGAEIKITDSEGKVLFSETPANDYEVFIVSSSDIVVGNQYKVSVGSDKATFTAK